jgi:hypothetical protein
MCSDLRSAAAVLRFAKIACRDIYHANYGLDTPPPLFLWARKHLAVPANRIGYVQFSGFQLKIIQEVITLSVFMVFAILFLKEKLSWNYLVAFAFLGVAAFFAFAVKPPAV